MLELSPLSRGVVNSGLLLLPYQKVQLERTPTMSERMHESLSPLRSNESEEVFVSKASSENRSSIRNSSEDPSISSTHGARHVSSNSRIHPRASNYIHSSSQYSKSRSHDKPSRSHDLKSRPSSHDHHHKTPKRKRSAESEEDSSVWTEHVSSSGRVYYYNKKEDKSQWEKPRGLIKKPKEELVSPASKSSSRSSTETPVKSSHTSSTHSRSHTKDVINHKESYRKSHHEHRTAHKGEHTSHSHRGSESRSGSRSPPTSTKHRTEKTPSRHRHSGRTVVTSPITPKLKSTLVSPTTPSSYPITTTDHITLNRNGDSIMESDQQTTPTQLPGRPVLDLTSQMVLNGPTTPADVSNMFSSPQAGLMDTSGLHPLQKALLLQNQFTQQQQTFDPSLCMTPPSALPSHLSQQTSHPSSPLIQSPLTRTPPIATPPAMQSMPQGGMFVLPPTIQGVPGTFTGMTGQAPVPTVQATSLQNVMSRLGYGSMDGYSFPDVTLLQSGPQAFSVDGDLLDKSLAESWTRHNDPLQSQVDGSMHASLQVGVADSMMVSGREAISRLRLEAVQLATETTDIRLSALKSLMEEINSR